MARSTRPNTDAPSPGGDPAGRQAGGRNSRLAKAATKRAAEKALGPMTATKDADPDLKLEMNRLPPDLSDGTKKSRAAPKANKPLDKGSAKTGGVSPGDSVPTRVTRSNAEIAEANTSTARKRPAPRSAQTDAGFASDNQRETGGRTGKTRRRAPAPGNAVTIDEQKRTRGRDRPGGGE